MRTMNLQQLIFQNNFTKLIIIIFVTTFISLNVQSEIPEKYKIDSSLAKCEGTDFKKWNNCYGEYVFPRIEYKGEWQNGNFHGQGILKEAWGDIFIGNFVNNKAEGFGRQDSYVNGEFTGSFGGELKNDYLNGKGYREYDGCREEGIFKDHELQGEGEYICENGFSEKGIFEEGSLVKGTKIYEDGRKFIGTFLNSYLHGKGEIFWTNGNYENGNYVNGSLEGMGTYEYASGDKYVGEWKADYKDGKGTFTWIDGDKYVGEYKLNVRSGSGKYYYSNGNYYEGEYSDGYENGKGKFIWADGDIYEGDWKDGARTGKGKYIYESGTVYEGEFKNNYAEGNGVMVYSSGDIYKGEFFEGYEHGQGVLKYENGNVYTGQFDEGYRHGKGKMVYANGRVYDGNWEDGEEAEGKTTLAKHTTNEKYYALIIGNNDYNKLENLDNAVNDAKDLEKVLKEKYGFETTLMTNVNSDETTNAIIKFTKNRDKLDNILIFYAGHGQLEKKQKRGYWLPTDAGLTQDSKWINNLLIKDLISGSDAKHILLIVDSCFAGALMRGSGENKSIEKLTSSSIAKNQMKKTRLVMTSGGNEEVVDGIGNSKNSVFVEPLIRALKDNNRVIRSIELFQTVRTYVENNADQVPEYSLIHGTGHDGGEFLFFPVS